MRKLRIYLNFGFESLELQGTITVKKDVIQPYYDYHEEEEEDGGGKGVTFKDAVEYIEDDVR